MATTTASSSIQQLLGAKADSLLGFSSPKISKERLHLPGPDFIDRIFAPSDRNPRVLAGLHRMFNHGRLAGTGYLSILPVDQGIEHSAGASFAKNPDYFDGENIVKLAIEGGCNAVASTFGVLGSVARKYAHKIPFIVKINHNELLTFPNRLIRFSLAPSKKPTTWAPPPWAPPSISAPTRAAARSSKSARPSPKLTISAWPRFSGATSATTPSKRTRTTTSPPTSPARPITSASPFRPTSSSRSFPKITAATLPSTSATPATANSTSASTPTWPVITRSISPATRSPTVSWAARASSILAALPAPTISKTP